LGLYHFALKGYEGRDIFLSDSDYPPFIEVLASLTNETRYRVYALCLLPGRAHLALRMSSIPLQEFMQQLTLKFSERLRRKQGSPTAVFARPHRFRLVDEEDEVRKLIRFIHVLPCGVGQDAASYAWSGHRTYLGRARLPGIDARAGLRLFGPEGKRSRQRYADYVLQGMQPSATAHFTSLEHLAATVSEMGDRRFQRGRSSFGQFFMCIVGSGRIQLGADVGNRLLDDRLSTVGGAQNVDTVAFTQTASLRRLWTDEEEVLV
jgi:hypothetical protein